MTNKPVWVAVAAVVAAFAVQGCAQTGEVRNDAPPAASPAPMAAAPATAPSSAAVPVNDDGKPVVKADTKENFEAVAAAIRKQMQPGGRWQYIDNKERTTIDGSFADMGKLYDQFGSVDKMDSAAKVRLLADQSTVNAILTKKDGERLICQDQIPVGSHLPVKTCKTYAQIQAERNTAQDYLRRHGASPQNKSPGAGGH